MKWAQLKAIISIYLLSAMVPLEQFITSLPVVRSNASDQLVVWSNFYNSARIARNSMNGATPFASRPPNSFLLQDFIQYEMLMEIAVAS